MMIKANVNIETAKRSYAPGDVIQERLSAADMAYLEKHGFITRETDSVPAKDAAADGIENLDSCPGSGNPGEDAAEYKGEAELKKLNKDEILGYAKSIGLDLSPDMLKNDMIDSVLNHIDEQMAEME